MISAVDRRLVILPAKRVDLYSGSLFLEPLNNGCVLDQSLDDAESIATENTILVVTSDDPQLLAYVDETRPHWFCRARDEQERNRGYFTALKHAHDWAVEKGDGVFSSVLILEPSHPFRPKALLQNAIDLFYRNPNLDTVVSVVQEYGNLWTADGTVLRRIVTPYGKSFFREVAGLCLLTKPKFLTDRTAMGRSVGFVVVEEQWALIDLHGHEGLSLARRYFDTLSKGFKS